jgi:two-component system, cell cycle response regulator
MRILVAENDPSVLGLLEDNLTQWGYQVVICGDGADAWQMLQDNDPPTLALLEWDLPGMDGPEICRQFRELANKPYVYIILLTDERSKEEMLEGLEAGADEYIVKPIDVYELQVRMRTGNRIVSLQETFISVLKLSEHEAAHDPLTGLWNRPAIADLLVKELGRSRRDRTPVGVIAAGLDQTKRLAQDYGDLTRDSILREVVLRIHSTLRSYDLVGCIRDENFLIVAPGCDEETARALAERLSSSVRRFQAAVGEEIVPLTMSCGVVAGDGTKHRQSEFLIKAAEEALRIARIKGGGVVEVGESRSD